MFLRKLLEYGIYHYYRAQYFMNASIKIKEMYIHLKG